MDEGWRRLAQAMVELAIADWRAGAGSPAWSPRGKRAAEAAAWLFDPNSQALMTFEAVCEILERDPSAKRATIQKKFGDEIHKKSK
jgi:hypothetical protein